MSAERSIEAIWKETKPLNAEEVRGLLTHTISNDLISEALRRTNTEGASFAGQLLGREFGYVVFGNLSEQDRNLEFSSLFEGQEGGIDLYELSESYLWHNPTVATTRVLDFHTHTHLYLPFLKRIGDLAALKTDDRENDYFSERDFRSYFYQTRENPFLVRALGTEVGGVGQLLIISFGSFQACQNFDYEKVFEKSKQYLFGGIDPTNAYREAGLNVANLAVNLVYSPVLDIEDINRASLDLTKRES